MFFEVSSLTYHNHVLHLSSLNSFFLPRARAPFDGTPSDGRPRNVSWNRTASPDAVLRNKCVHLRSYPLVLRRRILRRYCPCCALTQGRPACSLPVQCERAQGPFCCRKDDDFPYGVCAAA